jgi:hypothetical protein
MNAKRSIALKTFGMVIAALVTVGISTGPADAASAKSGTTVVQPMDSGWGRT